MDRTTITICSFAGIIALVVAGLSLVPSMTGISRPTPQIVPALTQAQVDQLTASGAVVTLPDEQSIGFLEDTAIFYWDGSNKTENDGECVYTKTDKSDCIVIQEWQGFIYRGYMFIRTGGDTFIKVPQGVYDGIVNPAPTPTPTLLPTQVVPTIIVEVQPSPTVPPPSTPAASFVLP